MTETNTSFQRLAVRVTPDAVRRIRGGHPWVYDRSVTELSSNARTGDLGVVFDRDRRFVAIGMLDMDSPIRLRVLHRTRGVAVDGAWWQERVRDAIQARRGWFVAADTNAWRAVNGEGDGLPGLVIDVYDSVAVVKIYTAALERWMPTICDALVECGLAGVVFRRARRLSSVSPPDGTVRGAIPDGLTYLENGIRFEVDPCNGQKTGAFLDQRDNRKMIRQWCAGANVADVFAHAGGFALNAAAGGASSVVICDRSRFAIAEAERNWALNPRLTEGVGFETACGDAFEVMDSWRAERFDVVVVDPPSFAQRQADRTGALRAYGRLTQLAARVVAPGGVLVQASCSAHVSTAEFAGTVSGALGSARGEWNLLNTTAHSIDHPVTIPESAYLKCCAFRRVS